jgi:hypothetical protein
MKILLITILFLSTIAHADTPIFEDTRFVVSIEEKPSVTGKRKRGPCARGQEIFLRVSALPSKKVLLKELIESCLKNIDLEESVDESVVALGKQIFVFQTTTFGTLDLNGEAPVYQSGTSPAEDVKNTVMKLENCHHWGGEEPTREKRKNEISGNIKKLGCGKLPAQIEVLRKKYSADPNSLNYLDAAVKEFQ